MQRLGEPNEDGRRRVLMVYELAERLVLVEVSTIEHTSAPFSLVWRRRQQGALP